MLAGITLTRNETMHTTNEALAECARCQGRRHGDCDSACLYWFDTASHSELEEEFRRGADARVIKTRGLLMATQPTQRRLRSSEWGWENLREDR